MKKLVFVLFVLVLSLAVLADTPPVLDNHQFYGDVFWDESLIAPTEVITVAGGASHITSIRGTQCATGVCSGSYGRDPDTILRVQGTAGQQIVFYLNDEQVASVAYEVGKAQELDLLLGLTAADVAATQDSSDAETSDSADLENSGGCRSDWNCTAFSACANGKQSRFCQDENECSDTPARWNRTEERNCGAGVVSDSSCTYNWVCTLWSACFNSQQTRHCGRQDACGTDGIDPGKPEESKSCGSTTPVQTDTPAPVDAKPRASCFDAIQNQNELEIDCGGVCPSCKTTTVVPKEAEQSNLLLIVGVGVLALVVIGLVVFLIIHKKKSAGLSADIEAQLDGIYNGAMEKGVNRAEVTQKLLNRGWDQSVITKYLTRK